MMSYQGARTHIKTFSPSFHFSLLVFEWRWNWWEMERQKRLDLWCATNDGVGKRCQEGNSDFSGRKKPFCGLHHCSKGSSDCSGWKDLSCHKGISNCWGNPWRSGPRHYCLKLLIIHFPTFSGASEHWASKWTNECSGKRERSKQRAASKRANGRAIGPVFSSQFLVVLNYSKRTGVWFFSL